MGSKKNSSFTVDVEDGVSIAMRDVFGKAVAQTHRVVNTTNLILELLDKHQTKATFFVLGQVAEKFPELVKRISSQGHEIGVHGYNHLQFFLMTPAQAKEELLSAKHLLEDLTGQKVLGHRAPAFSISPATGWAFEVLQECGFSYDSSVMPIKSNRYGWADFPEDICIVSTPAGGELIEVPIKPVSFLGKKIPYSGGSYLRLLPFSLLKAAFKKVNNNILYIHPYELDTERYPDFYFKELAKTSLLMQMKMRSMWLNRSKTLKKLKGLLELVPFSTVSALIEQTEAAGTLPRFQIRNTAGKNFQLS